MWAATVLSSELPAGILTDVAALPVGARRGAAEVFANDPGAAPERSSSLPVAALELCEVAVDPAGAGASDSQTARAALARDALAVVLRLYRSGDNGVRSRCLDVIDRLSGIGAHGLTDALAAER